MWSNVLLHAIPIQHSAQSDPYLVMGLLTLGVVVTIFAGIVIGAWFVRADVRTHRAASALFAGALLFLLYDLLKQTASLGQGLTSRPLYQALLILAFAGALVVLPAAARGHTSGRVVLWVWALGIGMHGAGEAWIVGTEALTADLTAPPQVISFLLHKTIEGVSIPLVATLAPARRITLAVAAALGGLVLIAGVGGFVLGAGRAPVVLFALGAGAATSGLLLLARKTPWDARHASLVGAGVAAVYITGLLHEL